MNQQETWFCSEQARRASKVLSNSLWLGVEKGEYLVMNTAREVCLSESTHEEQMEDKYDETTSIAHFNEIQYN